MVLNIKWSKHNYHSVIDLPRKQKFNLNKNKIFLIPNPLYFSNSKFLKLKY